MVVEDLKEAGGRGGEWRDLCTPASMSSCLDVG